MDIFGELADNELSGCTPVVGADASKWGHFVGSCARLGALLVGWWDWPRNSAAKNGSVESLKIGLRDELANRELFPSFDELGCVADRGKMRYDLH